MSSLRYPRGGEELDRLKARAAQIIAEDARQTRHERFRYRLRTWLEA
ncbi:hypothetical protein IMCC21224_171, partial [Puniceibacterium sp. IMCC21224]